MPDLLNDRLLLTSLAAILALLVIAWVAARVQTARRNDTLAQGFADSTRSRLTYDRAPAAGGFVAAFDPPPDPFVRLVVDYRSGATVDPIGLLARAVSGRRDRLVIRGLLPERPAAELVWAEGRIPGLALARRARASLWVQRRSDLIASEYAVRGADTTALEYVFVDLQARFGPLLHAVTVTGEREDVHVEIVLAGAGLRASEAPGLVATVRSLGRAARRR